MTDEEFVKSIYPDAQLFIDPRPGWYAVYKYIIFSIPIDNKKFLTTPSGEIKLSEWHDKILNAWNDAAIKIKNEIELKLSH